ncbi:hypothetical protein OVA24_08580 [Luteolibacter sp. SL250]|uniref:hypothetical protein n=1 Tax=Luteolibacter sp. SL250 TaxID=2995170 RepID=UPI00226E1A91|nr:hypothetical protein [Luteolibacter sp. SL250]WAC21441.1 hypothetical protein OVA24_08580 [Luteolibacter sp. SL250]
MNFSHWHADCGCFPSMDKDLHRYLNGHLAGSHCALSLIAELSKRQTDSKERKFFEELEAKVETDQRILKELIAASGGEESTGLHSLGEIGGKVSRLLFLYEGMEPGKLGNFEALEMLALGIQGKRLLWVALQEVAHHFPEWSSIDFQKLEFDAIHQREEVEDRRICQSRSALADPVRKGITTKAPAA